MSNTQAPFGFRYLGVVEGTEPNFGLLSSVCAYNASAIYEGDPLILTSGKLAIATVTGNTGAAVVGIAKAFSWVSTAQKRKVWQNFYPGSDSQGNADVEVLYVAHPQAIFEVQVTNGGPAAQADVGSFFNFATGAGGSTYSGISSMSLDYATKNASQGALPFVLHKLEQVPRTDPASIYNLVQVRFATLTLS